jgi:serine phosphatase RsbU (regulator of sigma subunit)
MSVFDNVKDTLISIRNKRSEGHNKIELSYSQNDIIFNYVGIHFRNPKRNKYKYRLEPYDNDWKNDGILRSARYTNLDPGEYTFKVIAANSDGVWSKKYASINISILPPWWKTYWAYSFYILFVIGLLYSVRKFELNRQKKNTEIKESKLKAEAAESQAKAAEAQAKVIQAENERKTKELEEARQLQLSMLPKTIPSLPYLDIAVYMKTATEVGGDYYDFNVGLDGTLTVAIGDATGHGMQAGTIVSMAKALFASGSSKLDMKTYFNQSSDALKQIELGRLMMAFMMIKIYDHKLEICNAGMPPLFIYRKQSKQVEEIMLKGMPLGALKNFPYEIIKTEISTGDTFLLLSDGLPELKNKSNNQYGYERVRESFGRTAEKQPEEIITYLKNEDSQWINDKEPDDDITFVVIKVK